jgi:glycogen(starch) synthase
MIYKNQYKEFANISLLMTADTVGGVWTYALDLIRGLEPLGVQVHLATMGNPLSRSQQKEVAGLRNLVLHESNYKLEWMDNPWEDVEAAGDWLLNLEEEIQPDIIHLNNYCHGNLPWQAPLLITGHSCVLSWWQAVKGESAPKAYQAYAERVHDGLHSADVVVAPSKAFLGDLQRLYGQLHPSVVIPNARNNKAFSPGRKEEYILSVGRLWDEAKNISACQAAAAKLAWPIEVAGETEHPSGGRNASGGQLRVLGPLEPQKVAKKLSTAAIYVLPARYEPFGLSVLEAALSGCALVLGDIPSLRENWQGAALFANPDNPEDLQEKINFLIKNPRQRQRLSGLALQKGREFDIPTQANQYFQQYRQLLIKRTAHAGAGLHQKSPTTLNDKILKS